MDFLEKMNAALSYIEKNIAEEIDYSKIAKEAGCSEYHFSRMFSFLAGQGLSCYIRKRKLSNAAIELQNSSIDLLEIAVKYGYSSVDSFSRAFKEIHNILPSQVRSHPESIKYFPRIRFNLSITGGHEMTVKIIDKDAFRIIGICKHVQLIYTGKNPEIDSMWASLTADQIAKWKSISNIEPKGIISASTNFSDDRMRGAGKLDHYIGVATTHDAKDYGSILEVNASKWAVFEVVGKFPEALQTTWGRIYSEWFPVVPYETAHGPEILWNEKPDTSDPNFRSEIWIPIRERKIK